MKITGKTLIAHGWKPGSLLGSALKEASEIAIANPDFTEDEIVSAITGKKVFVDARISMSKESVPVKEALSITGYDSKVNYDTAFNMMHELGKTPVVEELAMMPDACPASQNKADVVVGGVVGVRNAIIPSSHSADLCCSMHATWFYSNKTPEHLMDELMKSVHFGAPHKDVNLAGDHPIHDVIYNNRGNQFLEGLMFTSMNSLGTSGDGNHFAYLGKDGDMYVLVTHSGSRALGAKVYKRGLKVAKEMTKKLCRNVPDSCAWIPYDTKEGKEYWEALRIVEKWTKSNHEVIRDRFLTKIWSNAEKTMWNPHNFVWKRNNMFYHGKGATPAWKGTTGLIPFNMREPILIVEGKGNEYLDFCPHGAGRNESRTSLNKRHKDCEKKRISAEVSDEIDVRWYSGKEDFSELPVGYKSADHIRAEIEKFDLCDIVGEITPIGSIMGGEFDKPWMNKKK